jgi:alpha-L-arabinofuranosidase
MATSAPATPTNVPLPLGDADIRIDASAAGTAIDPRLLGTNVPAWMHKPDAPFFNDTTFLGRTKAAGASVLRLPGGSWGNYYDWLGCETKNEQKGNAEGCNWLWAARPTDFVNLLKSTGKPGMWTVSSQGTSQSAAALVAFFNGDVADTRPIGVDANGHDWLTVGHWAKLRSDNGNPAPQKIQLWEIGNEIYGAKRATGGANCSEWGWEDVWTCDPAKYIHGDGTHEGYIAFRTAMQKVDPSILVGAVGVAKQADWNNWGNIVMREAGKNMDFYSIHHYSYGAKTDDYADILAQPQVTWKSMMRDVRTGLENNGANPTLPIAVTEFNIFAFSDLDTQGAMNQAINCLYMADTIGQLAQQGFSMANQFNLANASNDRDVYGMLIGTAFTRTPQYYAFPLWSQFGSQMLPLTSRFDAARTLSVYAGRSADGTLTILAINKTGEAIDSLIQIDGAAPLTTGTADVIQATSLQATSVTFNGVSNPSDDLKNAPATKLKEIGTPLHYSFAPYSVTLLRLKP